MKVIFMGTPDFSVPVLQTLLDTHTVAAVVTQPDRPKGRGHAVAFPPVKEQALLHGVPVLQPETLRDKAVQAVLRAYAADVFVVAAYGLFLPMKLLDMPVYGCVNVHASLLPKYRGAAPMQYAIMNGETVTGITMMYMARGMDTGDIILQRELTIGPDERFPSLHDRMAALGGQCTAEALSQIEKGTAERRPQHEEAVTYAAMITKDDGHIDWSHPTRRIINLTRALDPWPGPYTVLEGQALKIWVCQPAPANPLYETTPAGTVIAVEAKHGFMVKTGDGAVWVTEVQSGGGKRMKAADYLRGHPLPIGTVLR